MSRYLRMQRHWLFRLTGCLVLVTAMPVCAESLQLMFTDESGQPVADVVIMVEGTDPAKVKEAEMAQRNRAFDPHVLVVGKNSTVDFPNFDATQHHVYSFSPAKTFDIQLYSDRPEEPVLFDQSGIVELGCNIHDQMRAFIVVTDSDNIIRSDEYGIAELDTGSALDSGDTPLILQVWHPRLRDNGVAVEVSLSDLSAAEFAVVLDVQPEQPADTRMDQLQQRYRDL